MSSMNITKPRIIATATGLLVAAVIATGATIAIASPGVSEAPVATSSPTSETVDTVTVEVAPEATPAPEVVTPAAPEVAAPVVVAPPAPAPVADPEPIRCPAGSSANSNDGVNDTSCFPDICFTIPLPDAAHPECDVAFKP